MKHPETIMKRRENFIFAQSPDGLDYNTSLAYANYEKYENFSVCFFVIGFVYIPLKLCNPLNLKKDNHISKRHCAGGR